MPNVHKLILKTAGSLAGELYETVMGDNAIRAEWKKKHPGKNERELVKIFVKRYTLCMVPAARSTLAGMLALPYDQAMKDEIYEALLADNSLARPREVPILSRTK